MTTPVKHPCARCGKPARHEQMIYSRHTRLRYCADFQACDRRYARQPKVTVAS
jgi:hypothetical protein